MGVPKKTKKKNIFEHPLISLYWPMVAINFD